MGITKVAALPTDLLLQPEQGQDAGAVHIGDPGQIDLDRPDSPIVQNGFHIGKQPIRIVQRDPPGQSNDQLIPSSDCT